MNHQATLAPPYDPSGHFESPYYHYNHAAYWGGNGNFGYGRTYDPEYWNRVNKNDKFAKPWALLHQANSTSHGNSTGLANMGGEVTPQNQKKLEQFMQLEETNGN